MTTFDERQDAFEKKFAHDEALKFKVDARANKLLGMWAASLLGKDGETASEYAREVINADFEEAGREDVFRKLSSDLEGKASEATIRQKMDECAAEAKRQVIEES